MNNLSQYNFLGGLEMKTKNVLALAVLAALTASNARSAYYYEDDLIPLTDIVIQGGDIRHLIVADGASGPITVDILGGYVNILNVIYSSEVNISGGRVRNVFPGNSATVNLYGGQIDNIAGGDDSIVNVFGYDLASANIGGSYGDGWVSGFWADDTPFSIDLYHSNTYSHIVLHDTAIPEPATVLLLGLGGLAFLRKRRE